MLTVSLTVSLWFEHLSSGDTLVQQRCPTQGCREVVNSRERPGQERGCNDTAPGTHFLQPCLPSFRHLPLVRAEFSGSKHSSVAPPLHVTSVDFESKRNNQ